MNKTFDIIFLYICIGTILFGCSNGTTKQHPVLDGSEPPEVKLKIGNNTYDTVLGSYCWPSAGNSHTCVETAGPFELVSKDKIVNIQKGETIEIVFDYKPLPNKVHVTQMEEKQGTEKNVEFNNSRIIAPEEQGTYFYAFSVWWIDDVDPDISHGDAFYAFAIQIE